MTLILFAILLSFVVLLPKQTGIVLEGFGAPLAHVLAYPVRLLAWMNQGVEDFWDGYIALHHVQGDNERLRRELAVLQGRVHELEEQSAAMERLAALLEFKERTPANTIAAEVIGIDSTNWYRGIILNKGERHGIQTDMGVITPAGVVGRVVKTAAATSVVLLVTDPNMAVTGLIQRTRDEGIVTGSTKGAVYMKYIPLLSTVREQDVILTSGLTGDFPKGLMIGTITKISKTPEDLFLSAQILPVVNFSRLEEVLVITEPYPDPEPEAQATLPALGPSKEASR